MSTGSLAGSFRWVAMLAVATALQALPAGADAQDLACDPGDLEVRRLSFVGNHAFSDATLANSITTTPSSWARRALRLPFTRRRCLDPVELPNDSLRLVLLYTRHGYQGVRVGLERIPVGSDAVQIRFTIDEGAPVRVDSLSVAGLPARVDSARLLRGLRLEPGIVFDKVALQAAEDSIKQRLRNQGYPRADILTAYEYDRVDRRATVDFTVLPGPLAYLDSIRVRVDTTGGRTQEIPSSVVRHLSGLERGRIYRERDLLNAQRNLYQLETYRYVEVQPRVDTAAGNDSSIIVDLNLVEGNMQSARLGVGWATFDCLRTQAEYVDRNFLRGARRLEISARLSKIGIGAPLDQAPGLCPQLEDDQFSDTLNYYVSATFRQPVLFGLRTLPSLTIYSQLRSEFGAYLRSTPIGGVASLTRPVRRLPFTYAYQLELGRTEAEDAVLCVIFDRCVEEEREFITRYRRLAVASVAATRSRTDDVLNPTRGSTYHLELRHSSGAIGSNRELAFNKVVADGAWYRPMMGRSVLAARLRFGAVLDRALESQQAFVPPEERLYAGGATTVRGFAQNELGPVIYIVNSYDTIPGDNGEEYFQAIPDSGIGVLDVVPTGGNSMVVANLELRTPSPVFTRLVQLTFFTDVGEVWNRERDRGLDFDQLKWTPGVGLRIFTPFGALRVDVGYNRYDRPTGIAFYDVRRQVGVTEAPLYCVSPGNTRPIDYQPDPQPDVQLGEGCSATFTPRESDNFFQRLNFNVSLGQAF